MSYSPAEYRGLTFHDAAARFSTGDDTPRAYLERCLATIAEREGDVKAWVCLNEKGAREAADAATRRYQAGAPLSPIDGLPIGIKDLLETQDMPTEMGCDAYRGNFPKRDNAAVWALRQAGAIILGKTVTTELGGTHPGPTTNPFNAAYTPGGSSSARRTELLRRKRNDRYRAVPMPGGDARSDADSTIDLDTSAVEKLLARTPR